MWINEQTLEIFRSHTEIRSAFPNVSFPPNITDEIIAEFGVLPVHAKFAPTIDHTQNVSEGEPIFTGEYWEQSWVVSEATDEEVIVRTEAQWSSVRADRNVRLAACDWTQLPDAPVDAAPWAEYRQALRDITQQADPFAIVWPAEPGA